MIVLKRQPHSPKPVPDPLYPLPDLLLPTDILVNLGNNNQDPLSQLKITNKYVKSSFYNEIPQLPNCKANFV